MADQFAVNLPAAAVDLVQKGLIERAFHDGLVPALQYRAEASAEEWPANTGVESFQTRAGLLAPVTTPLIPGKDPEPQATTYEQWVVSLKRFAGRVDTHMPTAMVANSNLFVRNVHQLGIQAGMSMNRIPRNEIFRAYLSGHTRLLAIANNGDTQIHVCSLNGFTDVLNLAVSPRPQPVSSQNPLSIVIGTGAAAVTRNVIGFTQDSADPLGPGFLQLSAIVGGGGFAATSPVKSTARPTIIRSGGGDSVDAIGSGDTLVMQDFINAANTLHANNVQPHDDGFFHAHISPEGVSQLFADPVLQRLNTALPEGVVYSKGFFGQFGQMLFFRNPETPKTLNAGAQTATTGSGVYSADIGAETVNDSGVSIGRALVTGKGGIYERYLDESQYITEAGTTGKIGEFSVVNNGLAIMTERIRLVLAAPTDALQDNVRASWSISTCFPIPSDVSAGGPQRYKRMCVIEHAL